MQLDLGQQMSFQIHIQGADQLTDVRVAKTVGLVFLQCISMNAKLSCIVSRPHLAYSHFTKGLFKTR